MILRDALVIHTSIKKLLESSELPIVVTFKLKTLHDAIKGHVINFEEQRDGLIRKLGVQKDNTISVLEDKTEEFNKELSKVQSIDVGDVVGNVPKILLSEFQNKSVDPKPIWDLLELGYLVKEDTETIEK